MASNKSPSTFWWTPYIDTLYVCAVPWGDIMSTVGDIMSTVGGYLEYRGGVQYRGGYHDKCGGISWVPWRVFSTVGDIMSTVGVILSTVGDIMMHVGDIMSTVGGVQYRGGIPSFEIWVLWRDIMMHVGGYHEYRGGCSVPWGISWVPWGLSWVPWGISWCTWGISWVLWGCSVPWGDTILWNLSTVEGYHDACGGYHEYRGGCSVPWGTQITKDFSPKVLNTLHGTHDIPPRASWYPHGTEHPPRYSR